MDEQGDIAFGPGDGINIFAWLLWVAAIGLLIWALASPTALSVSETDAMLARIDPTTHPLPNPVNNIGLMHERMLIFLSAGFTAVIGTLLYGFGAIMRLIARPRSPSSKYDRPYGADSKP